MGGVQEARLLLLLLRFALFPLAHGFDSYRHYLTGEDRRLKAFCVNTLLFLWSELASLRGSMSIALHFCVR
jgi:hypothetical protein